MCVYSGKGRKSSREGAATAIPYFLFNKRGRIVEQGVSPNSILNSSEP
jgi:hypothetical protein